MKLYLFVAMSIGLVHAVGVTLEKQLVIPSLHADSSIFTLSRFALLLLLLPGLFSDVVWSASTTAIVSAFALGLVYYPAMYLYYAALKLESPSVLLPIFRLIPLFSITGAALFLGQVLAPGVYVGVSLVLLGALIITVTPETLRELGSSRTTAVALITGSTVLYAIAELGNEVLVESISPTVLMFWALLGSSLPILSVLFRGSSRAKLANFVRTRPAHALSAILAAQVLYILSRGLYLFALERGPVTIVSPLISTESVFILLIGGAISLWNLDDSDTGISREMYVEAGRRTLAVAVMCLGVWVLYNPSFVSPFTSLFT